MFLVCLTPIFLVKIATLLSIYKNEIKKTLHVRLHDTMVLSKEMCFDYLSCYSCTNGVTIVANQDHIFVGSLSIGSDSRP